MLRGQLLDGSLSPAALDLKAGDVVALRNFKGVELRLDGESLSLKGEPSPGQPPLRLRWLSLADPEGATGRVIATRLDLLRELSAGMDLYGLPDPLERLPATLNEPVSGTQSTIHGDLNLENALVGPGDFIWLIDFAMTRDGHTLFDFAHLEAHKPAHGDRVAQLLGDGCHVVKENSAPGGSQPKTAGGKTDSSE